MLAISSSCCPREQLITMLDMLERNGLGDVGVEIFYDALPFYDNANITDMLQKHIERGQVSFHYPMDGVRLLDDADSASYRYSLKRLEECLHTAQLCGARHMVLHASLFGNPAPTERWQAMRERWMARYPEWAALAARYGVAFWVENSGIPHHHDEVFTQAQFLALFEQMPELRALIDIGHAHDCGWDLPFVIAQMGDKIEAYHLHNNDGVDDCHWPLRRGTLDYDTVLKAMSPKALMVVEYGRWTFDALDLVIDDLQWLRGTYGF